MGSLPRPDGLPLAGVDELTPAHVMTMLRPGFYGQAWTRDYENRTRRYAAVVAMHALAGAGRRDGSPAPLAPRLEMVQRRHRPAMPIH
jgi:hypothetical protein